MLTALTTLHAVVIQPIRLRINVVLSNDNERSPWATHHTLCGRYSVYYCRDHRLGHRWQSHLLQVWSCFRYTTCNCHFRFQSIQRCKLQNDTNRYPNIKYTMTYFNKMKTPQFPNHPNNISIHIFYHH